ncbi:hypothetical protein Q4543_17530 [Salipiger sp. 1_MG-2023]|uniref:hypothetical protein n=1 Tax=Salipiger sp. 1_MG-2023 TaxID=3062665 RepID=UPI0026E3A0BA|nr:hypothetical protein [Salipiger sp. 1_MG-2023]MDO6587316.1 hypothetical protein [Salipiger sp. 1_MG-2023]
MWTEILDVATPAIVALFGALLTAIINSAAATLKAKTGIEIEARHRDALHAAILSGVNVALSEGLEPSELLERGVAYAKRSVPDAIQHFAPSDDMLRDMVKAKAEQAIGRALPIQPSTLPTKEALRRG